jgi:flagellin
MISLQTNVNSLVAQQNLSVNSSFQSKTIQQLTSGYRINQSGDDAAGLAVANKFRSTIAELTQGVANGNDATAQLQIMDGGMNNISLILDRLKTLATQSASGTFTGSRTVLNAEFQNALSEIDRQAQSIGLNTGGLFAKNLDVFLGAGSGSTSLQNGIVTLGLTASAVDSQSLGMKGMEAVGGPADLGTGASSVASIVADTTNQSTEATAGYATLSFSGAGYSDAGKVKVQVNLSSVSDTASLVSALNSAMAAAGTGSPQALAFARAGIVASVVTDSTGQHLGFTSSTSAFQVQAGDKMANAMLGNFLSGSQGADITTSVTGATTDLVGNTFAPGATGVTVRIQGSGLAAPVDLNVATGGLVGAAITSLQGQVSSNAQLAAAGISLSVVANQLVFTSATGETLSVMATGDKTNQLGLGSFARSSASTSAVDYKSITSLAVYDPTTTNNDQATMQFSINGAAATALTVDLTGGDATASKTTSSAYASQNIVTGVNDALTFSVDGIAVSATLSANAADAKVAATSADFVGAATHSLHAAYSAASASTGDVFAQDFTNNNASFTVKVDGQANAQTINLTGNYTVGGDYVTAINAQLTGATASYAAGALTITSNTTGAGSHVNIIAGAATEAQIVGSLGVVATDYSGANTKTILVTTADQTVATITLSRHDYTAQDIVNDINYNNGPGTVGFHAALINNHVALVSDDAGLGAASTMTLAAGTATLSNLGLVAAAAVHGDALPLTYLNVTAGTTNGAAGTNQLLVSSDTQGPSVVTITAAATSVGTSFDGAAIVAALNTALAGTGITSHVSTGAGVDAATAIGTLLLTSTGAAGANTSVSVNVPALNSALGALHLTAGTAHGGAATAASIASTIQTAIDTATGETSATPGEVHATVTVDNTNHIVITNDNKGLGHNISALAGTAATSVVVGATQFLGLGAQVAGTDRTGTDLAANLNQQFASNTTLQKAQLTASFATGQLTVASTNNTNFRVNSGTTASATMTATGNIAGGVAFGAGNQLFQVSVDGGTTWKLITLSTDTTGTGGTGTAAEILAHNSLDGAQKVVAAINTALAGGTAMAATATLVTNAGLNNYSVKLTSNDVSVNSKIQVQGPSGTPIGGALATGKVLEGLTTVMQTSDANLGFGLSGSSFATANLTSLAPKNFVVDSGGASQALATLTNPATALAFNALLYGNDSQAITISANDANGNQQSTTVTLKNLATGAASDNQAGRNIDQAISYINAQLQASNNATLQKIVAVKQNVGNVDKINFISSLASFNVGVGSTANGVAGTGDGVNGGISTNVAAGVVGAGANMQVDSKESAKAAVTALAAAIAQLGSAQAAVGKGQNQLYYAVNLANSQITNFSAAESYLRDANVAQQAANLSKAQVLSQASIAAMAQANSAPQAVLALLRG